MASLTRFDTDNSIQCQDPLAASTNDNETDTSVVLGDISKSTPTGLSMTFKRPSDLGSSNPTKCLDNDVPKGLNTKELIKGFDKSLDAMKDLFITDADSRLKNDVTRTSSTSYTDSLDSDSLESSVTEDLDSYVSDESESDTLVDNRYDDEPMNSTRHDPVSNSISGDTEKTDDYEITPLPPIVNSIYRFQYGSNERHDTNPPQPINNNLLENDNNRHNPLTTTNFPTFDCYDFSLSPESEPETTVDPYARNLDPSKTYKLYIPPEHSPRQEYHVPRRRYSYSDISYQKCEKINNNHSRRNRRSGRRSCNSGINDNNDSVNSTSDDNIDSDNNSTSDDMMDRVGSAVEFIEVLEALHRNEKYDSKYRNYRSTSPIQSSQERSFGTNRHVTNSRALNTRPSYYDIDESHFRRHGRDVILYESDMDLHDSTSEYTSDSEMEDEDTNSDSDNSLPSFIALTYLAKYDRNLDPSKTNKLYVPPRYYPGNKRYTRPFTPFTKKG